MRASRMRPEKNQAIAIRTTATVALRQTAARSSSRCSRKDIGRSGSTTSGCGSTRAAVPGARRRAPWSCSGSWPMTWRVGIT